MVVIGGDAVDREDVFAGINPLTANRLGESHGANEILRKAAFQRGGKGLGACVGETKDGCLGLGRPGRNE